MKRLIGTLLPPEKPNNIPSSSKWLSGQGAGVWFYIEATDNPNIYRIKRFTPEGELDCDRLFEIEKSKAVFNLSEAFEFTHISHCSKCKIIQNEIIFVFKYIG
ncbi:MAG: hypothetical protein CVT95_06860 [Bacteroidetes bacterium HGW-Bacteroidetes-12]|nr:MAG: hypothetical protein CVT95_06860 [Bacteroidetes bacterium HGW-Bacteroidetes-12]